jgi:hypothetical protein
VRGSGVNYFGQPEHVSIKSLITLRRGKQLTQARVTRKQQQDKSNFGPE